MSAKPRVVIDTQVFLRAALNPTSLSGRVIFELSDNYQLLVSGTSYAEVSEVLYRPRIRARYPHLTDAVAEKIVALYADAEWVTPDETLRVSRDPKDDVFLAIAAVGEADYIVSEDKDLLVLNPYEGIQILNVPDFLRLLQDRAADRK